jgi:2-polyprenyl-3-methyl-5-hydroxy-6-metoxy-1,4-benzoquinol methylase
LTCGLLFKDIRHHLSPQGEKHRYDCHSANIEEGYRSFIEKFVTEAILPFASGNTILDFGCGRTGLLGKMLSQAGFFVSEFDLYYKPDKRALSEVYDMVIAIEVVEHFQDPVSGFRDFFRLLKPGGTLALRTMFTIPDLSSWWYLRDSTHYCFYCEKTFKEISSIFGFEMLYSNHKDVVVLQKR